MERGKKHVANTGKHRHLLFDAKLNAAGMEAQKIKDACNTERKDVSEYGTFSIRVVDEDGNGVSGAKVSYQCMSGVGNEHTNSDGRAEFEIIQSPLMGGTFPITKVWVNSHEVSNDTLYPEDGDTFTFVLP